jgi:TldD protein
MLDNLEKALIGVQDYVELRYHERMSRSFVAHKNRVDVAHSSQSKGLGVRVLVDGFWGFSSTTQLDPLGIAKAIEQARASARLVKKYAKSKGVKLQDAARPKHDYIGPGFMELSAMDAKDKLAAVVQYERSLAAQSKMIHSAKCRYSEILEDKSILTSDGVAVRMRIALPEVGFSAVAEDQGKQVAAGKGAGVNGDWQCLFAHPSLDHVIDDVAKLSVDLIHAGHPEGGLKTCILDPAVVGLLCHEAIGHTVEADFVKSGSVAQGKIGSFVASPLVSMADTGCETIAGYAVGNLPYDDEGVPTETTDIIVDGKLVSYLHNRETAKRI